MEVLKGNRILILVCFQDINIESDLRAESPEHPQIGSEFERSTEGLETTMSNPSISCYTSRMIFLCLSKPINFQHPSDVLYSVKTNISRASNHSIVELLMCPHAQLYILCTTTLVFAGNLNDLNAIIHSSSLCVLTTDEGCSQSFIKNHHNTSQILPLDIQNEELARQKVRQIVELQKVELARKKDTQRIELQSRYKHGPATNLDLKPATKALEVESKPYFGTAEVTATSSEAQSAVISSAEKPQRERETLNRRRIRTLRKGAVKNYRITAECVEHPDPLDEYWWFTHKLDIQYERSGYSPSEDSEKEELSLKRPLKHGANTSKKRKLAQERIQRNRPICYDSDSQ